MPEHDDAADLIALAGLARTLEQGGIYNGAKLVRAILDRETMRLADAAKPMAGAEAASALERLAARADGEGPPGLGDALRSAAIAARADTPLALADAPPVYVCRTCGELALRAAPARCPRCEAPALAFREHLPVWYLEPIPVAEALAELASGPAQVDAIVGEGDDAILGRRPRAGEWSARDTLEHLATAEELLALRAPRLLNEDDPMLVASAAWAETGGDEGTSVSSAPASLLAARYRGLREATVALLRGIPDAAWQRPGRHPEWGRVTVHSQVVYFVRHQASHMAQLAAAADGRLPGEGR